MLTSNMLAMTQRIQALTFDHIAQVVRSTEVSDGAGGTITTRASLSVGPCRVAPATLVRDEALVAGMLAGQTPWRITIDANREVSEADDILVATVDERDEDGFLIDARTFEVAAVYGPESRETARVAICSERLT